MQPRWQRYFKILGIILVVQTLGYISYSRTHVQYIAAEEHTEVVAVTQEYDDANDTTASDPPAARAALPMLKLTGNIETDVKEIQLLTSHLMRADPDDLDSLDNGVPFGIQTTENDREYVAAMKKMCEIEAVDKHLNVSTLCPCILQGAQPAAPDVSSVAGRWVPRDCVARRRVAVIIPFRDRYSHLQTFLKKTIPILQLQRIEYRIFLVEQAFPYIFNKGSIMNAGFLEAMKRYDCDCVLFHDVDMLPDRSNNIVHCHNTVVHLGAYVNKFRFKLLYYNVFGGALAMEPRHFILFNGYSNTFYGWGGEDDNFFRRIRRSGVARFRPPVSIARYSMIKHKRDLSNPVGYSKDNHWWGYRQEAPEDFTTDGLNNVNYTVEHTHEQAEFTHIVISIHDAPESEVKISDYDVTPGDCFGNDLTNHADLSRVSCQRLCDESSLCAGFVYLKTDEVISIPQCFLKDKICDEITPLEHGRFFTKTTR